MIKIYYCDSSSDTIPEDISDYRKEKILAAGSNTERIRMIGTAKALRAGFAELGLRESDIVYGVSEFGKPFASNREDIHFSISHSDNISIVAFCDNEIGIDCEKSNRTITNKITERFFSEAEASAYHGAPLMLWVVKEAIAKQSGAGLLRSRSAHSIPYFEDELFIDGLWLKRLRIGEFETALCAESKQEIRIKRIDQAF